MKIVGAAIAGLAGALIWAGQGHAQSAYGCTDLSGRHHLSAVEGANGMFYRVEPDLRNFHAFSDETVADMAELSRTLAALGTTLVYVPVPTKALVTPGNVTSEAVDFGFDVDIASTIYDDIITRLSAAGVVAVNARKAMVREGEATMFRADHRWTARGAQLTAEAVGEALRGTPLYAQARRAAFVSSPTQVVQMPSEMREVLQKRCMIELPRVETMGYATSKVQGVAATSGTSVFNSPAVSITSASQLAVLGSEYTGTEASNFAGFLSEATGLDVLQYAVPDAGPFAAISSYMTSEVFQSQRPAVLVWENPVHLNLASFGDQPMRELIAAAGNTCRVPLNLMITTEQNLLRADLSRLDPTLDYTLFVDTGGAPSGKAVFEFRSPSNLTRTRTIQRHENQVHTGRFYMPLTGLWREGAQVVDIKLDVPFGSQPRVSACFYTGSN
ncbi:MAG: hypothetical protein NXH82_05035 [Rhodobacteraceae bacterium]|nr:hypothetical protein [Paracoccaceae bacterium]